jgi:hypothetical protein
MMEHTPPEVERGEQAITPAQVTAHLPLDSWRSRINRRLKHAQGWPVLFPSEDMSATERQMLWEEYRDAGWNVDADARHLSFHRPTSIPDRSPPDRHEAGRSL